MSQYTYRLNPQAHHSVKRQFYKRSQLEHMTTFLLQEICRKENLVITSLEPLDREGLIRLIMRFRGQKDHRHIADFCEGGMERIQQVLDKVSVHTVQEGGIRIPANLVLYNQMALDEIEQIMAESEEISLYEGNLLLVDETFRIHTCLYLKQIEDKYYICKGKDVPILPSQKHQYSILYFTSEQSSEYFYDKYWGINSLFPGSIECLRLPLLSLDIRDAETTELPLVIDFGSCNTTMGICLPDGTRKIASSGKGPIIPSVVGIAGAQDDKIHYIFGHEAVAATKDKYQDQDVPVFYDIKRWISDPGRSERVILDNGIKIELKRTEMLKVFFEYLLEEARKQFKLEFSQIQLLAPIRQKEKFESLFEGLIPGVQIDCSLDEGMAVLFFSIDRLIAAGTYEPDEWYQALILDCGGGTTDLTSGQFRIHSDRVSYTIDLETKYENGDTNFGGNNLTYRILQLLKINICKGFTPVELWAKREQEDAYKVAENYLPTAFEEYADKGRSEYFQVKNNYYYLFDLAEQVKKFFFQPNVQYELWIGNEDSTLHLDKWKLSVLKHGKMEHLDGGIRFPVYLHQIEALLRADIYDLMKRFLEPKFRANQLNYAMTKLTGQSCKSKIFEDALKEYIPGALIQRQEQERKGNELKMCCLEGALAYFFNCKLGYMNVTPNYHVGALPYEIIVYTHEGKEERLVHSSGQDGQIGFISRFMIGRQLDIHLTDHSGRHLKTYYYGCSSSEFKQTTQEQINQTYAGTVIQEQTDIIQEGEMKFFVWVNRGKWGFTVLPVRREKEMLYIGKEAFFDFEDDTWEQNFFDGRK